MDKMIAIKEQLVDIVHQEMMDVDGVCTEELGEAIDMIKDMAEAIYYCTIVKAMHEEGDKATYKVVTNPVSITHPMA